MCVRVLTGVQVLFKQEFCIHSSVQNYNSVKQIDKIPIQHKVKYRYSNHIFILQYNSRKKKRKKIVFTIVFTLFEYKRRIKYQIGWRFLFMNDRL